MRIISGGVGKAEVADALRPLLGPADELIVSTDMDAALKLKTGAADYYLGTCHTGAGASLGVLVGLLGGAKCHTFGRKVPTAHEIDEALADGKVAFGFSIDQISSVVPELWAAISRVKAR